MKTPTLFFAVVALIAAPTTLVQAEEKALPERGPIPFESYDHDGDGFVTQMEFTEMRNKRIQEKAEQGYPMRGLKSQGAPAFAAFDTDNDGKLTREELQAGQMSRRQERQQERWERKENRGMGPRGGGKGGGGQGGGANR